MPRRVNRTYAEMKQKHLGEMKQKAKAAKYLTGGQAKIAAKAPPPNKIDEKDFAVLREEKAKGRGMGLQDESVQPGKVMKAKRGHFSKSNISGHKRVMGVFPTKEKFMERRLKLAGAGGKGGRRDTRTITDKGQFVKRRMKLAGSKLPGRIGTALGVASMMVPAAYAAMKQYKDYKSAKNRDEAKVKKMGGGMMNKPMGYSKGTMVMARGCKLGRKKATKIT